MRGHAQGGGGCSMERVRRWPAIVGTAADRDFGAFKVGVTGELTTGTRHEMSRLQKGILWRVRRGRRTP